MASDKLSEQSMDFAVQIINLVKQLKEQRESIISNQIGRSGTSIGANIREAKYAHGTADFISKMQIALKEANETGYWLELLYKTNYIGEEQYNSLEIKCKSLRAMLVGKKARKRFTSTPLDENAVWHLFICTKIQFSKNRENGYLKIICCYF